MYSTAVALRGKDGVVFAVEKLVTSKLYEVGANRRIFNIDRHVGMVCIKDKSCMYLNCFKYVSFFQAVAGLLADSRQIVETTKTEAANYRSEYGNDIPLKVIFYIIFSNSCLNSFIVVFI